MERYSQDFCAKLHEQVDSRIYALDATVYGNGQEGLTTKVAKIEQDLPGMKADLKAVTRWQWMALGVVAILQPLLVVFLNRLVNKI